VDSSPWTSNCISSEQLLCCHLSETNLPDLSGQLSKVILSSTIAKVYGKVSSVIEKPVAA